MPLLSFTPQVTAGAWVSTLLLRGAGPVAVAAAAGAALAVAVGPRAVPCGQPPAAGPVLRVLTANLLVGRALAEAVVELACRKRADVLFVQELTDDAEAGLQQAGLGDLLPYRVTQPVPYGTRGSIYARYRLRGGPPAAPPPSAARCTAQLDLPVRAVGAPGLHTRRAAETSLVPGRYGPVARAAVRAACPWRQHAHPRRRLQRHRRSRAR